MATFYAYSSFDMFNTSVWSGDVIYASGSQVTISDGYRTTILYGSFYYDPYGYIYSNSVITGIYTNSEVGIAEVVGVNLTVAEYDYYLSDGNNQDLYADLTSSNDFFYGSSGVDNVLLGDGNDVVYASGEDDIVDGGSGLDTFSITAVDSGSVSVLQIDGGYSVSSYQGTDDLLFVEQISLSDGLFSLSDLVITKTATSTPGYRYFELTGDDFVDAITHGYAWELGADRTIDFAVANGFFGEYWLDPQAVLEHMETALSTVSYYADVRFNNLGFFGDASIAYEYGSEITLSVDGELIGNSSIWAIGAFPNANQDQYYYEGFGGDLFLNINSEANYLPSYEPGSAGWALLLHELGHVLGLKHPHDDGGTGRPTFDELGLNVFDIDFATVMSYNDDMDWNQVLYDPATPMILDVLGLQYLYGKNLTVNTDDSTYSLVELEDFYVTIWDADGLDTIDASTSGKGWRIQLPENTGSTLVDTRVGVALSVDGTGEVDLTSVVWLAGDMENLKGSIYSDVLQGNEFDNQIHSGGGADEIVGGLGIDTLIIDDLLEHYFVSTPSAHSVVTGLSNSLAEFRNFNIDSLDVEYVQFSDHRIPLQGFTGMVYEWQSHTVLDNVLYSASTDTKSTELYRFTDELDSGRVISASDALAALKIAVGLNPNTSSQLVTPYQLLAADINKDGRVSAADALSILKMAVGLDAAPDREWLFVNESMSFWEEAESSFNVDRTNVGWDGVISDLNTLGASGTLVAVLSGDVNGSWIGDTGSVVLQDEYFYNLEASLVGPSEQWWVA